MHGALGEVIIQPRRIAVEPPGQFPPLVKRRAYDPFCTWNKNHSVGALCCRWRRTGAVNRLAGYGREAVNREGEHRHRGEAGVLHELVEEGSGVHKR